jgi:predicted HicB family RNase H-like nuclease
MQSQSNGTVSLLKSRRRYHPKTGSRVLTVTIRLYPEELNLLEKEANQQGMSVGQLIKQKLLQR